MTGINDDEGSVTAWLEDGPSRAPERIIDAALAHARTHPRRRDPLASFRKDPIASNTIPAVGRPLTLLAAAALIVVALFAATTVGGAFRDRPAVVEPTMSPSTGPTATVTTTPSPTLSATPSPVPDVAAVRVQLITTVGPPATSAYIFDASGSLIGARSGQPGDGSSMPNGGVDVQRVAEDPFTIEVTWSDTRCTTSYAVRIDASLSTLSIERLRCGRDTATFDRVLRLTFDHAFDTTGLEPSFGDGS